MQNEISAVALQKKWEETLASDDSLCDLNLRLRRALSWLRRAEKETADADAAFIFHWIAFNAACSVKHAEDMPPTRARAEFDRYFKKVISFDGDNAIYNAIWKRFSGPVRVLLNNRFVFGPFWEHHNQVEGYEKWENAFEGSKRRVNRALAEMDTQVVLSTLFDRLYVLRNQLLHGAATWGGSVNRNQVRDGARIMGFLMPHFIDLMMENPSIDWGAPYYPVVQNPNER